MTSTDKLKAILDIKTGGNRIAVRISDESVTILRKIAQNKHTTATEVARQLLEWAVTEVVTNGLVGPDNAPEESSEPPKISDAMAKRDREFRAGVIKETYGPGPFTAERMAEINQAMDEFMRSKGLMA